MAQRESEKSRKLKDLLRVRGFFAFKTHGQAETLSGLPDILACKFGKFAAIETKVLATHTSAFAYSEKQKIIMQELAAVEAYVIGAGWLKTHDVQRVKAPDLWVADFSFLGGSRTNPITAYELVTLLEYRMVRGSVSDVSWVNVELREKMERENQKLLAANRLFLGV